MAVDTSVRDPDGTPSAVYATHEDTDEAGSGGLAMAESASCGCAENFETECCGEVRECCAA